VTQYDLPDLSTIAGTFRISLFSEFAGLTKPTIQTVVEIGDLEESAAIGVAIQQLSTLSITLRDDYSTYTDYGFWFKVLSGETHIRLYLNQGGSDLFYFYGTVQPETVSWGERFINHPDYPGTQKRLRTVSFDLVSIALKMFDTPTVDWETEVVDNSINTGREDSNSPSFKISVMGLFSAMLSASELNSSYSLADTSFVYNTADLVYNPGGGDRILSDLSVAVKIFVGGGGQATTEYFSGPNSLSSTYATLKDLLVNLLPNFGVVLRMTYDIPTERHLIQLIQRGRAYPTTLDFENREKKSTIRKSTDLLGDAIKVTFLRDTAKFVWFSKKYVDGFSQAEPPNYVDFDVQYETIFIVDGPITGTTVSRTLFFVSGTSWTSIQSIKYWNYDSDAYVTSTATNEMEEAVAGYLYYRFTFIYSSIMRTYSKLMAGTGTDHTVLSIFRRLNINDGLATNTYYANKVRKRPKENEVEIEWILE
jgi:hypothetical protein